MWNLLTGATRTAGAVGVGKGKNALFVKAGVGLMAFGQPTVVVKNAIIVKEQG